jgi:hypothetical protein
MAPKSPETDVGTLWFNGIDVEDGVYYTPEIAVQAFATKISKLTRVPGDGALHAALARANLRGQPNLSASPWLNDLSAVHWAAVLSKDADPNFRKAIAPLVEYRKGRVLEWYPGEEAAQFLDRYNTTLGNPDYEKVPFYLLLAADPRTIPFSQQFLLGIDYAVGRLWGSVEELQRYSSAVVGWKARVSTASPRPVTVFAPDSDRVTRLSATELAGPIADWLDSRPRAGARLPCERLVGDDGTKANLLKVLTTGGAQGRLIFTASHGAIFRDPAKRHELQGALICQEWPGCGPVTSGEMVAAADVAKDADLRGNILFNFACFSAGTPSRDGFWFARQRPVAAGEEFVARLPAKLLEAGAFAVVGHVDAAWSTSFNEKGRLQLFCEALGELLAGERLGKAMYRFATTHAAISTTLLQWQETQRALEAAGVQPDPLDLVQMWLNKNDARAYSIIGDPAVTLGA